MISAMPSIEEAQAFADDWYEAWNAHDLDRVLSHYREDVRFSSPFVVAITRSEDGTIVGRPELARYFARALEAYPDLRFEPLGLFVGAESVVLHYRSVLGLLAAELMSLDGDRLVTTAMAHYDRLP